MARSVSFLLVTLILVIIPVRAQAGDVFTGFQIDNKSQYFGYLGVRTPVLLMSGGTTLFAQAMTAGLGYSFKSSGQLLDANIQFVVPSLGISQSLGRWTLLALAGPQLRRVEEARFNTSSRVDHQVGFFGQIEGLYWHEKGSLHAIGSYADLDDFFWGRLRGKLLTYKSNQGCCPLYTGWDIAGMGNGEYRAIQTGPILEIPIGKVFFLVRGGYQNSTSFHSGGYGGAEVYFPF
ncbi:MAG: hypothetical protein IPM58_09630 [Nitrospira sp.]|nr:hypothetical protein [Nitrospira sp.]